MLVQYFYESTLNKEYITHITLGAICPNAKFRLGTNRFFLGQHDLLTTRYWVITVG